MPAAATPESAARGLATSRTTLTHCPYCSLQCGMSLERANRTLAVRAWAEFPEQGSVFAFSLPERRGGERRAPASGAQG